MNTKNRILAAAAAVALAGLLAWAFVPRPVEVEAAAVTQGRFETTIDEDGKTRITERQVVSAPLAGHLARITLREGDTVGAERVVATLTPLLPALLDERTQRELRARVAAAQDNILRAASRSDRAEVALEQARNEARRSEQLAQQGFIAPTKLDSDRLAILAAEREARAAEAERRIAMHELEQARAALGLAVPSEGPIGAARHAETPGERGAGGASGSSRFFQVRAPAPGRVLRVLQTSEATVALGTPLIEIGDSAYMEIVAELLTADALAATPGSSVRIERWGGPQPLQGRVRAVEPAAFTKVSALGVEEQRVRVLIDLVSPQEQWAALGDAYRVGLRIVTLVRENAVQVPVSAVFPLPAGRSDGPVQPAATAAAASSAASPAAASAAAAAASSAVDAAAGNGVATADGAAAATHAVFVIADGKARLRPLQLGARNGGAAWVRSGLTAGEQVIVYPGAAVRDGVRVKVRKV